MSERQNILDNVAQYSAEELAAAILAEKVTFDDLVHETEGEFSAAKRREVKKLLAGGDDSHWEKALAAGTVEALQEYLSKFPDGGHREEARRRKEELQNRGATRAAVNEDESRWRAVDKTSAAELQAFFRAFPDSHHAAEARDILNRLQLEELYHTDINNLVTEIKRIEMRGLTEEQKANQIVREVVRYINERKATAAEVLEKLSDDHNLFNPLTAKSLIESGVFSLDDMMSIGIDNRFLQKMMGVDGDGTEVFSTIEKFIGVKKKCTEVYFWGIPASGKSCALGAIMSVAASGTVARSMDMDPDCQGYGYMNRLINMFRAGEVNTLMGSTALDDFYEMGFDLTDDRRKVHPITCIDMAGELMRCMYKENAKEKELEDVEKIMLATMRKTLSSTAGNRKMHFFVVEYGAEDRLFEGLPQRTYLEGAAAYIKNTGIFHRETDAVYILVTKADKAKTLTPEAIRRYVEENYRGFYNNLENVCRTNNINGGRVEIVAFSLGEVCFQNYCRFDPRAARNVVNIMMGRSAGAQGGKKGFWARMFKS